MEQKQDKQPSSCFVLASSELLDAPPQADDVFFDKLSDVRVTEILGDFIFFVRRSEEPAYVLGVKDFQDRFIRKSG